MVDGCSKPKEEERHGASERSSNLLKGRERVPKAVRVGTNFAGNLRGTTPFRSFGARCLIRIQWTAGCEAIAH